MTLELLTTDAVSVLCAQTMVADPGHPVALDLTDAALLESDPAAERARLRTRGFGRARMATWRSAEHPLAVSVTLYRLESAAQAELAVHDTIQTLRAAAARMGTVDGMAGAAISDPADGDDSSETFVVTFSVATTHAVVLMSGAPVALIGRVARAQHETLSG